MRLFGLLAFIAFSTICASADTSVFEVAKEYKKQFEEITNSSDEDERKKLIEKFIQLPNELAFQLAIGSFPYDRDILESHILENLSNADSTEALNGLHVLRMLHEHSGKKSFRKIQWTDEQRLKVNEVFKLIKSTADREIAYAILLSENKGGVRSFLQHAVALSNEDPLMFAYALNSQPGAILEMSGEEQSKVREAVESLGPLKKGIFQDIFLANETPRAESLLKEAISNKNYEASKSLYYFVWEEVLKKNDPKINELILQMLISKEAHLRHPRRKLLQQFMYLPEKEKKILLGILKKAALSADGITNPYGDMYSALGGELGIDDMDYLRQILGSSHGGEKILHILNNMDIWENDELRTKVRVQIGTRLRNVFHEKTRDGNFSESEFSNILNLENTIFDNDPMEWLNRANFWLKKKEEATFANAAEHMHFDSEKVSKHFFHIYKNREKLTSKQKLALVWLYLSRDFIHYDSDYFSEEEIPKFEKWIIDELKKLSLEDLHIVLKDIDPDAFHDKKLMITFLEESSEKDSGKKALYSEYITMISESSEEEDSYYDIYDEIVQKFNNKEDKTDIFHNLELVEKALSIYKPGESNSYENATAAYVLLHWADILRHNKLLKQSNNDLRKDMRVLLYSRSINLRRHVLGEIEKLETPSLYFPSLPLRQIDTCSVFCSGVNSLAEKFSEASQDALSINKPSIFKHAVDSIKALVILKGAKICNFKKFEQMEDKISESFSKSSEGVVENSVSAAIARHLKSVSSNVSRTRLMHSAGIYELTFSLNLVEEILQKNKTPELVEIRHKLRGVAQEALTQPNLGSTSGSGMNLYAYGAMLDAFGLSSTLNESELNILDYVDKIIDSASSPQHLPYEPVPTPDRKKLDRGAIDSERGSVARALTLHSALYTTDRRKDKKAEHRKNLLQALENYFGKYFFDLAAHLQRDGTHTYPDYIAPYYLYPSLFYSTSAFNELLNDKELSSKERERVLSLKKEAELKIKSLLNRDGKFRLTGGDDQTKSQYKGFYDSDQALGLMALSAHVDCNKEIDNTEKKEDH